MINLAAELFSSSRASRLLDIGDGFAVIVSAGEDAPI
jgi:hypothetical protein